MAGEPISAYQPECGETTPTFDSGVKLNQTFDSQGSFGTKPHFPSKSTVSIHTPVSPPTGERPQFQEMLREGTNPRRPFDIVLVLDDTRLPRLGDDFDRHRVQLRLDPVETWTVM